MPQTIEQKEPPLVAGYKLPGEPAEPLDATWSNIYAWIGSLPFIVLIVGILVALLAVVWIQIT
jgi:hypothetical protein